MTYTFELDRQRELDVEREAQLDASAHQDALPCLRKCLPAKQTRLRAYWADGDEQGTTGMYYANGNTESTDFALGTTMSTMRAYFEGKPWADFGGEVSVVWSDGSETKFVE